METSNLIRTFHTVCTRYGVSNDQKQVIYESFGTDSSRKMSRDDLQKAINTISQNANDWRRRVMAAIGGYLNRQNIESNPAVIKAIACRAAKATDFNKIEVKDLRRIYNQFLKSGNTVGGTSSAKQQVENYFETIYNQKS